MIEASIDRILKMPKSEDPDRGGGLSECLSLKTGERSLGSLKAKLRKTGLFIDLEQLVHRKVLTSLKRFRFPRTPPLPLSWCSNGLFDLRFHTLETTTFPALAVPWMPDGARR